MPATSAAPGMSPTEPPSTEPPSTEPKPSKPTSSEHPALVALHTVEAAMSNWDLVANSWLPQASDEELVHALDEMDRLHGNLEALLLLVVLESARRRSLRDGPATNLAPNRASLAHT